MLGKLIKYEFKATARVFLPGYLLLLVLALISSFSMSASMGNHVTSSGSASPVPEIVQALTGVTMMAYVFLIMGTLILTAAVIIQRFYKNLTGEEGYLMHTLPVSTHHLVLSKLITAFCWGVVTILVIMLSVFILLSQELQGFKVMGTMLQSFRGLWEMWVREVGVANGLLSILLLGGMMIASACSAILMVYASIAIGQTFKKHRVMGSIGTYIAFSMLASIIGSVMGGFGIFSSFSFNFDANMVVTGALLVTLGMELVFSAIWYFVANYILTTQLNLE